MLLVDAKIFDIICSILVIFIYYCYLFATYTKHVSISKKKKNTKKQISQYSVLTDDEKWVIF